MSTHRLWENEQPVWQMRVWRVSSPAESLVAAAFSINPPCLKHQRLTGDRGLTTATGQWPEAAKQRWRLLVKSAFASVSFSDGFCETASAERNTEMTGFMSEGQMRVEVISPSLIPRGASVPPYKYSIVKKMASSSVTVNVINSSTVKHRRSLLNWYVTCLCDTRVFLCFLVCHFIRRTNV